MENKRDEGFSLAAVNEETMRRAAAAAVAS